MPIFLHIYRKPLLYAFLSSFLVFLLHSCALFPVLFSWIFTSSTLLCTALFSLVCCLLDAHVYTIILIWWSQIVKSPSFTSNSVNQWLFFFHSPANFCSFQPLHYMYAKDLFRFLMRVFLLFDFDRIGKQRLWYMSSSHFCMRIVFNFGVFFEGWILMENCAQT